MFSLKVSSKSWPSLKRVGLDNPERRLAVDKMLYGFRMSCDEIALGA
jgi:hypothetical protein